MNREDRSKLAQFAYSLRRNMTRYEKKLWNEFLREYPLYFSCQRLVGPYIVDFYCKKVKLSIELDGSQHYEPQGLEHDMRRTLYIEMCGIQELRFPNSAVWEDFEGVCNTIHLAILERRNDVITTPLSLVTNKR